MQLKSLRLFMAVAETGSFVAAAQRLYTVQSNVTAHIKKLEEELSVQLVQRSGVTRLTPAGFALKEYAIRILAAHDEALAHFSNTQKAAGTLRIGAMETTMALRLPPLLATYHAAYPDVNISLHAGPTAHLTELLLNGATDGVFVAGRLESHRFYQVKVFSEQLVLVGAKPMPVMPSAEQLLASSFLAFREGCSYRQRVDLLLASCGVNAARIVELGSLDAILGCVAAGMGYSILPLAMVEANLPRFAIHYRELPKAIAAIDTYFVTVEQGSWTPALTCFVAAVHEMAIAHSAVQSPLSSPLNSPVSSALHDPAVSLST